MAVENLGSRRMVVSGGASWADDLGAPMRAATPADESVARKWRRLCVDCITCLLNLEVLSDKIVGSYLHHGDPPHGPLTRAPSQGFEAVSLPNAQLVTGQLARLWGQTWKSF